MLTSIITSPASYKGTLLDEALMYSIANIHHTLKHFDICVHSTSMSQYSMGQGQVIMDLAFNDNHIIYYSMHPQCSADWHRPISLTLTIWLSNAGPMPLSFIPI